MARFIRVRANPVGEAPLLAIGPGPVRDSAVSLVPGARPPDPDPGAVSQVFDHVLLLLRQDGGKLTSLRDTGRLSF